MAWKEVGADFRAEPLEITAPGLPASVTLTGVPGVEEVARAFKSSRAAITSLDAHALAAQNVPPVSILALETGPYQRIAGGTPIEPAFPRQLTAAPNLEKLGSQENPIPAVVSTAWPERAGTRPAVGDLLELQISSSQFTGFVEAFFQVVEVRDALPHFFPASTAFVVVAWDSLRSVESGDRIRATDLYVGGPGAAPADLEEAIGIEMVPEEYRALITDPQISILLFSREERYADLHEAPLSLGVEESFQFGLLLTVIYATLAVVFAFVRSARRRSRDVGYLSTLGLSRAQALWLTLVEQIPAILFATVIGVLLGIWTVLLIEPGLDLTAFVGEDLPLSLTIDWNAIAIIAIGLALVVTVATVVSVIAGNRIQLSENLKVGD